jgi:hypothetical protein
MVQPRGDAPAAKRHKANPKPGSGLRRQRPSKEQLRSRVSQSERENSIRSQSRETPTFHQPRSPQPLPGRRQAANQPPAPQKALSEKPKDLGKIFALTIWPWPSPSWWIGNAEEEAAPAPRNAQGLSKDEQILERAKQQLDAKKRAEFLNFIRFEKDISHEVWTTKAFQSAVTIFLCGIYLVRILITAFPVYGWGTSRSI